MSASKLEGIVISQLKNYLNSPAVKRLLEEQTSKPLITKQKKTAEDKIDDELNKIPIMRQRQQEAYEKG
jgi:hypothetical protein